MRNSLCVIKKCFENITAVGSRVELPGSNPCLNPYWWCDFGQVIGLEFAHLCKGVITAITS